MMAFNDERQRLAYERVRDFAYSLFGETNVQTVEDLLALQEGSTVVYLRVFPITSEKPGVEVFSYVVTDVPASEELMRFLLTYNLKLTMGAFGLMIEESNRATVLLTHTIPAEALSKEGLYLSVSAVARVADNVDDLLVEKFGGRTAIGMHGRNDPHERWE